MASEQAASAVAAANRDEPSQQLVRHLHPRPDDLLARDHGAARAPPGRGHAVCAVGLRQPDLRRLPVRFRDQPARIASPQRVLRPPARLARPPRLDPQPRHPPGDGPAASRPAQPPRPGREAPPRRQPPGARPGHHPQPRRVRDLHHPARRVPGDLGLDPDHRPGREHEPRQQHPDRRRRPVVGLRHDHDRRLRRQVPDHAHRAGDGGVRDVRRRRDHRLPREHPRQHPRSHGRGDGRRGQRRATTRTSRRPEAPMRTSPAS